VNSKIKNRLTPILFAVITAAVITAAVVSVCVGKYTITTADIQAILKGEQVQEMTRKVFTTLRLPRTVMALIAGVGLGIAGSVYQIIFKNPLASPDIIGIAGGANLGAAVAIVSVSTSGMIAIAAGAFWGGLIAVVCVMLLVKATRSRSTSTYVLAGIVINAISKAVSTLRIRKMSLPLWNTGRWVPSAIQPCPSFYRYGLCSSLALQAYCC